MPELRCPECGKELLRPKDYADGDPCVCAACGREVYPESTTKEKVQCPSCGKTNESTVTR